jgi:hypothetical protein
MSHVSVRTPAGVRYSAEVTVHGGRECSTQTYSVLAEHGEPFTHSMVACGASGHGGGPILIQVVKPATRLILDRPVGGCKQVHIAIHGGPQVAVAASCSATKPLLRVTRLPIAGSLTINGIRGVTRLSMRDYPCSLVCIHEISTATQSAQRRKRGTSDTGPVRARVSARPASLQLRVAIVPDAHLASGAWSGWIGRASRVIRCRQAQSGGAIGAYSKRGMIYVLPSYLRGRLRPTA